MAEPFSSQDIRNQGYGYGEGNLAAEHEEGELAKQIERQTAKLPSDIFLWTAGAVTLGSVLFRIFGRKDTSVLISQLAPILLIMGLYNKVVKVAGHDRVSQEY